MICWSTLSPVTDVGDAKWVRNEQFYPQDNVQVDAQFIETNSSYDWNKNRMQYKHRGKNKASQLAVQDIKLEIKKKFIKQWRAALNEKKKKHTEGFTGCPGICPFLLQTEVINVKLKCASESVINPHCIAKTYGVGMT